MQQQPNLPELVVSYLPFVLVMAAAWFLLYKPERERMKKQQELLSGLKKNDRVLTTGGIYGTVANVDRAAEKVSLKVDESENVRLTVTLASIAKVLSDTEDASAPGG
ncbi:MAG: preprotein translocase subunit YajC [Planctomycetia bacterium]|nr:preprotein translocase subunit YajC [Planctomycetia bacterium]